MIHGRNRIEYPEVAAESVNLGIQNRVTGTGWLRNNNPPDNPKFGSSMPRPNPPWHTLPAPGLRQPPDRQAYSLQFTWRPQHGSLHGRGSGTRPNGELEARQAEPSDDRCT
jgi:hypothetical protein